MTEVSLETEGAEAEVAQDAGTEAGDAPEVIMETGEYGVGLTQEQVDSLFDVEGEQLTDSGVGEEAESQGDAQAPAEETLSEQPSGEAGEDGVYVIDGKEYSVEDIQNWKQDSENRHEWQKSNTQKSQELSDSRKALQAKLDKWKSVEDDGDLMDALRDYLGDSAESHPIFSKEELVASDESEEPTETKEPEGDEATTLKSRLEELEVRLQVERDIADLTKSHPELRENEDALKEVIDTMVDENLPSLEHAYVHATAKATEESAFKKAKQAFEEAQKAKAIPVQKPKAKGMKNPPVPKLRDYNDIREHALEHYELFR